ncbi:NUDIX hydrolase [Rossellomorea sp. FS2]
MDIVFHELDVTEEKAFDFAVISVDFQGQWIFVRHTSRETWEIPGGHREPGETIEETAKRELFEETGCQSATFAPICDYSIGTRSGRLFYAVVKEIGSKPPSEIGEIRYFDTQLHPLTYPDVQPLLFEKTLSFMNNSK